MSSPDVLDFAPERLVDPLPRSTLGRRLVTAASLGLVSLALNVAVVVWLARIGWPLRPTEATAPISVEIVNHMPGEGGGGAQQAAQASAPAEKPAPDEAKQANADQTKPEPAAQALAPQPEQPKPPEAKPETRAETPPAPPTPPPAPEPTPPDPAPAAAPLEQPTQTRPATPPPLEQPDNNARPQLVEAPKAPAPGATQSTAAVTPPPGPPPTRETEPPPPGPTPQQPSVLSSPNADEAVASETPPPEKPPEPTAEEKRQAEMTARLAAALPFGPPAGLNPFQPALSAAGQTASQNYRGAVYANFAKANGLIEEARAKHMRGQAVVAFSIDDGGNLANLAIAVSSGHADVDATALELIRRSAPFPPPPPGAQRHFSPAIGFGLDE